MKAVNRSNSRTSTYWVESPKFKYLERFGASASDIKVDYGQTIQYDEK